MKISIYADTDNADDVRKLGEIAKVLADKRTTKADLEKLVGEMVSKSLKSK